MSRICHSPWPTVGGGSKPPKPQPLFNSKGFNFFKDQRVIGKIVQIEGAEAIIDLGLADNLKWVFNDVEGLFRCGDFVEARIKNIAGDKVNLNDVVEIMAIDEVANECFDFWENEFDDFKWFVDASLVDKGIVKRLNTNGTALVDFGEKKMGVLPSNVGLTVGQEIEVVVSAFMLDPKHGIRIRLEEVK